MQLIFPFKNLAINNLSHFFDEEIIKEFVRYKSDKENLMNDSFENKISNYKALVPNLENELLQIINTTNQDTIDAYFRELTQNFGYIMNLLKIEHFNENIKEINEEALKKHHELVKINSKEYFEKEERIKYNHLEQYETVEYSGGFPFSNNLESKKVTKTNYNFYCVEERPDLIPIESIDDYFNFITELSNELISTISKYGKLWIEDKIKSKNENVQLNPIVFFEGKLDLIFFNKAAELFKREDLLKKIELRQRGSCSNLTKLWNILIKDNWETIPQIKILIYDCDTNSINEDFGHIYKRTIPFISENIIKKGIENLFPNELIYKAISYKKEFVDFKEIKGTNRGVEYIKEENVINKDEKKNFCDWVCSNGNEEDFKNFEVVFEIIENILKPSDS